MLLLFDLFFLQSHHLRFRGFIDQMGSSPSEDVIPLALNVNEASLAIKASSGKKIQKKVPKRIQKAQREKLKREHLNDLFSELSGALEMKQTNNGKASILCEATKLLKDLLSQIESLRQENASLISESHYVDVERNELKEENSTLENQIGSLQKELETKMLRSKPDLNAPPPLNCPSQEPVGSSVQQPHAVFVVPIRPDLRAFSHSHRDPTPLICNPTPNLSKPHARYPTSADSWPPQLLRKQPNEKQ